MKQTTITHQPDADADAGNEKNVTPRWLSLTQACRYCNMSSETLMKYIRKGDIYGTKKGGKWWVDKLSVDNFFLQDRGAVEETLERIRKKVA